MLFISSFVTFHFSVDGQMTVAEDQTKSTFQSYHEWELVVTKKDASADTETIYPVALLKTETSLEHASFPFKINIKQTHRNAQVQKIGHTTPKDAYAVNEYHISPLPLEKDNERNVPCMAISIDSSEGEKDIIIWGMTSPIHAEPITIKGETYTLTLRKKLWTVPFAITLNKIVKDDYPGTMMARAYRSTIVKHEGNSSFTHEIYMNHPLRHKGYTFFQSGYTDDPNTNRKFSTFAVVKNPTDRWPEFACYILSIGMLLHFGITFFNFLKKKRID